MQNKLLSGSHKDHEKRRGCRFWVKRIKALTGFHKARGRGKGFSLCTLLTIILLTTLIWSYEPHLATLLSPQEQLGLPTPDASQDAVKQDHVVRKSFHIRAETEDKLKPLIVGKTEYGAHKTPVSEESSTTRGSYAREGYLATKKQDKELEMKDKSKPLVENVQNTNPAYEEASTSKGFSTTQGSSASGESLERQKEEKKETADKRKPQVQNVPYTKLANEESSTSKGSITTQVSVMTKESSATKGSNVAQESSARQKDDKDSLSTFQKKETTDKSTPQVQNVPNTKLIDEESSTSTGSSTTQVSSTTEESSATKGSNVTQESLARQKEDKYSPSTFQKKDKSSPQVQNVPNTKLVDGGSPTSNESSTPQVSSMTQESSASKGTYASQESLPRQKEDKHSSSTFKKEDVPKPEDLPVQEPVLVDKETKDKPKSPSTGNEDTKPLADQSFASEGASATQGFTATKGLYTSKGSSPSKGPLTTDEEDKVPPSTDEKKDMAKSEDRRVQKPLLIPIEKEDMPKTQTDNNAEKSKPMAKESSVSKESSATQGSTATEGASASKDSSPTNESLEAGKNDKVSAYTYEKKDVTKSEDRTVHEAFVTRSKTKDKPKTQTDNVENKKQVAKESLALKESSETQGSSEWASATNGSSTSAGSPETKMENKVFASTSNDKKVCNYGKGRWVYDSKRPLYSGFKCKRWLSWMFACRLTVRPDFRFEHFRWQPADCQMPEFERHSVLKRMQNKTIAFVGDSIGRQQFLSFMCMLTGGEESPEVEDVGHEYGLRPKSAFRFPQTNTTILYFWSSCLCDLVPLNSSDPQAAVAMHLDRPPAFLRNNINKFDVLVLNTGHHWNRGKVNLNRWVMHLGGKPNQNKTLFNVGNAKDFTIFNIVRWVDSRLKSHPRGLKAFFTTISPRHFFGGEWNTGGSCENTAPLVHGREVKQDESSDKVAANAVKGTKVKLLDITALSALRDEGHISKYGHKADSGVRDCLHWCLPGIPDTWNEILAAQI